MMGHEKAHKKAHGRSLRAVIEKWLTPEPAAQVVLTRVQLCRSTPWRCVRVETARPSGGYAIVFFRHRDGSWCVFPPSFTRPAMGGSHPQPTLCATQ
ncbi:hypothetical protein LMG28688_00380 [Paraburkholderia caffeinitolerans]|uniref:Uncharacterized protein n=1 Tax=Paraburkholderia caffeinitolerans TaxID=1723730 RepID=A0A6J5FCT6_9BURK|nr:hypothetical protein LMG28688_00380 [Paraburkholderia caffeinitolerans]